MKLLAQFRMLLMRVFAVLVSLLSVTTSAQATVTVQASSRLTFTGFTMINTHDGWAYNPQALWVTRNGGSTWAKTTLPPWPKQGYFFLHMAGAFRAWAVLEPSFRYPKPEKPR